MTAMFKLIYFDNKREITHTHKRNYYDCQFLDNIYKIDVLIA